VPDFRQIPSACSRSAQEVLAQLRLETPQPKRSQTSLAPKPPVLVLKMLIALRPSPSDRDAVTLLLDAFHYVRCFDVFLTPFMTMQPSAAVSSSRKHQA